MATVRTTSARVVVVDSDRSDYAALEQLAAESQWKIHFLHSGRDALRLDEHLASDLWIINVKLPDMSGFDLVEMLWPRTGRAVIFLVTDQYRTEDEIRARSLGVAHYLCKPLEAAYLRQWQPIG